MHDGFSLLRPFCMKKVHCIELDGWFYGYGSAQCSIQGCTVSLRILRQCKLVVAWYTVAGAALGDVLQTGDLGENVH